VRGVTFGYHGGPPQVADLDLDVRAGETVALIGATGAGKSTLVKLIARFYDVGSGSIKLDGVDVRDLSSVELRRAIVVVTQEAFLFSGSVADNIALGRSGATRDEIVAAAEAVGADEFIRTLPEGYDTDVNKRGGRLSAGQRQLVAFARAFVAQPRVLILDEASSSLDMPSEAMVQRALERLLVGRTAIIIAHRLSTVDIADRVIVMQQGRVIADGTPDELATQGGEYAALRAEWISSTSGH
jgi:ATP-binding cassette subfamily B protein